MKTPQQQEAENVAQLLDEAYRKIELAQLVTRDHLDLDLEFNDRLVALRKETRKLCLIADEKSRA